MQKTPAVSVIVPCHNKGEFVAETLQSVLAQEGVSVELVVVDDASSDGSREVVARFGDRVHLIAVDENLGSTGARRLGAERSSGEYLMFLDADDVLADIRTLASMVEAARANPDSIAACPWLKLVRVDGEWRPVSSGKPMLPPTGDYVADWLHGWYIPPCAVLWPRSTYTASGGWREMGPWDDAELMMRALLQGAGVSVAEAGEAWYRILPEGQSLRSQSSRGATESRIGVLDTVARCAERQGLLTRYAPHLGRAYYELAQTSASRFPDLVLSCYRRADQHLGHRPLGGSPVHRLVWRVMGLERKERFARFLARGGIVRRRTVAPEPDLAS